MRPLWRRQLQCQLKVPRQRRLRDVHTVTQHIMVSPATMKTVGRVLLGVETDISQL